MLRVLFFWQRAGLARLSGQENKTSPMQIGRGLLGNAKRFGSPKAIQLARPKAIQVG
jgi:hypothetical protein